MRRTPLTLILAVVASLALLAGCGASGGDDDASDTTTTETTAPDGGTDQTTAPDGDDDDADDDPAPSGSITEADLEAILPTADDIGNGYVQSEDDDDEFGDDDGETDETDAAFEEACPALSELDFEDGEVEGPSRAFQVPGDEREISVQLSLANEVFTEDRIDELVDAFNECGQVDITDDESGMGIAFELSAERIDDYGDFGLQLDLDASFAFFGAPIEIQLRGLVFGIGDVGVFISASSGVEESGTGFDVTTVPLDDDVLRDVAALMEERVGSL